MNRPDWKDAPEWATHLIVKRTAPDLGKFEWAYYDGDDFKVSPDGYQCFHPDGYNHVEKRPSSS